jgi:hypothetical protein
MTSDLAQMLEAGEALDEIRASVRWRLAHEHVSTVHRDVVGDRVLDDRQLERLGFAPDVLRAFGGPDRGAFDPSPAVAGFVPLPEHAHRPTRALRLQLPGAPRSVALGLKLLRDAALGLDPAIELIVVVPPRTNVDVFERLLRRIGRARAPVQFVRHRVDTLFAQDNGKSGHAGDRRVLLLPRADPDLAPRDRLEGALLTDALGVELVMSRLYWDGGNVLCNGVHCFVGANTIAVNRIRLGLTASEVVRAFERELGLPVLVLGDVDEAVAGYRRDEATGARRYGIQGGQADFHLDLDVALLAGAGSGASLVALADVDQGLALLDAVCRVERLFEGHFLPADAMRRVLRSRVAATATRRKSRLAGYRAVLERAGYAIAPIPDLRILTGATRAVRDCHW